MLASLGAISLTLRDWSDLWSPLLHVLAPKGSVHGRREHSEPPAAPPESGAGRAKAAEFDELASLLAAPDGSLYLSDGRSNRIRVVRPSGVVEAVAGTGERGFSGDGGPARQAQLSTPQGLALDAEGNLYVADSQNHRVRRIAGDGTVSTLAGTGERGRSGDGGPAASAQLNGPFHLSLDGDGTHLFFGELQGSAAGIVRLR